MRSLVLVNLANLIVTLNLTNIVATKNAPGVVLANLAPKTVTVDFENLVVDVTKQRKARVPAHVLGICVRVVAIVDLARFAVEMMLALLAYVLRRVLEIHAKRTNKVVVMEVVAMVYAAPRAVRIVSLIANVDQASTAAVVLVVNSV